MRTTAVLPAIALIALITLFTPAPAVRAQAPSPKFEEIAALITKKMAEYGVPGVAFGVFKDGQLLTRGFGVTNLDDPRPVTPDTIFPIASISKTFTATAVMRLVEQGKLELDAPVQRYLPEFRVQDEAHGRAVTIGHLLTHTPGWEGQTTAEDRGALTLQTYAESFGKYPKLAEPGEIWSYNNAGFTLAGRLIEVAAGQSIQNAFRTLVFEPIGLTRSFTRVEDVATYPLAVAHRGQPGQQSVVRPFSRSASVAAGGVYSTVNDLLAFARFHMGDGNGREGKPVLKKDTLALMRAPRVKKAGTDEDMGLGWHLRRVGGVMTAAHGGTLSHILLLELVPERNLAFTILTNHVEGWRLIQDVERATLRVLEGVELDPSMAIGHRGLNETMPAAEILSKQPDPASYLGEYRRPPTNSVNRVTVKDGQLMLDNNPIAFYGPDRAVVTAGSSMGNPVEFLRDKTGAVRWVRYVGRIARRD
jgi:CubicO group peptidase (beta-lactamase class C family)